MDGDLLKEAVSGSREDPLLEHTVVAGKSQALVSIEKKELDKEAKIRRNNVFPCKDLWKT